MAVPMPGADPAHGWHGNVLLLREAEVQALHRVTLPGLEPRGALITDLVHKGRPLRVIAAHLGLLPASRAAQTRHLIALLAELDDRPHLLAGDLNEWRRATGVALDHLHLHFRDSVALPSFPARYPLVPLDRIMASAPAMLTGGAVHDTPLARRASDHLPLKARLDLP